MRLKLFQNLSLGFVTWKFCLKPELDFFMTILIKYSNLLLLFFTREKEIIIFNSMQNFMLLFKNHRFFYRYFKCIYWDSHLSSVDHIFTSTVHSPLLNMDRVCRDAKNSFMIVLNTSSKISVFNSNPSVQPSKDKMHIGVLYFGLNMWLDYFPMLQKKERTIDLSIFVTIGFSSVMLVTDSVLSLILLSSLLLLWIRAYAWLMLDWVLNCKFNCCNGLSKHCFVDIVFSLEKVCSLLSLNLEPLQMLPDIHWLHRCNLFLAKIMYLSLYLTNGLSIFNTNSSVLLQLFTCLLIKLFWCKGALFHITLKMSYNVVIVWKLHIGMELVFSSQLLIKFNFLGSTIVMLYIINSNN